MNIFISKSTINLQMVRRHHGTHEDDEEKWSHKNGPKTQRFNVRYYIFIIIFCLYFLRWVHRPTEYCIAKKVKVGVFKNCSHYHPAIFAYKILFTFHIKISLNVIALWWIIKRNKSTTCWMLKNCWKILKDFERIIIYINFVFFSFLGQWKLHFTPRVWCNDWSRNTVLGIEL